MVIVQVPNWDHQKIICENVEQLERSLKNHIVTALVSMFLHVQQVSKQNDHKGTQETHCCESRINLDRKSAKWLSREYAFSFL